MVHQHKGKSSERFLDIDAILKELNIQHDLTIIAQMFPCPHLYQSPLFEKNHLANILS